MKKLIKESGIRDINRLKKEFDDVIIVTHMDLDGVVSGIGMKYYFQNQGFNVIDAQIIQYGDKEWSLKNRTQIRKYYIACVILLMGNLCLQFILTTMIVKLELKLVHQQVLDNQGQILKLYLKLFRQKNCFQTMTLC